jgi:hypothetical protein
MNQLYAYLFLFTLIVSAAIPIIGYIRSKYYYIDTKPIHYWLNKKQKIKKRYKTFKKRNKKYLSVNKINRVGSYNKFNYLRKCNNILWKT